MENLGDQEQNPIYDFKKEVMDRLLEQTKNRVPIRKGCPNAGVSGCFCTGRCQEIIGWRDKYPDEINPHALGLHW